MSSVKEFPKRDYNVFTPKFSKILDSETSLIIYQDVFGKTKCLVCKTCFLHVLFKYTVHIFDTGEGRETENQPRYYIFILQKLGSVKHHSLFFF